MDEHELTPPTRGATGIVATGGQTGGVAPARRLSRTGRAPLHIPRALLIPAAVAYLYVVLWPSARGLVYSFTDWNGVSSSLHFVGLANYRDIIHDAGARAALTNTLLLAIAVTVVQNLAGLVLALMLNTRLRVRNVLRVVFFAPVVLTPIVSGYIWSYLLAPEGGVNEALHAVGLGALRHDWLGSSDTALWCIALTIVWQFTGYSMVIYLAGLQTMPPEIIDAAMVDGAGRIRRLVSVTLPMINSAVVINLFITLIGALGQFDQVYVMTGGGPANATATISTAIYKNGFQLGEYGYGTALSVVLALAIGLFAAAQYRLTSRPVQ